jgi:hypothetical protein
LHKARASSAAEVGLRSLKEQALVTQRPRTALMLARAPMWGGGNLGEGQEQAMSAKWKMSSIIDRRPREVLILGGALLLLFMVGSVLLAIGVIVRLLS